MHREILGLRKGDKKVGDHINGNGLDNREFNLRAISRSINSLNRNHKQTGTSSKYIGVYYCPACWKAQIRNKCIGVFDTEEEAHNARQKILVGLFEEK